MLSLRHHGDISRRVVGGRNGTRCGIHEVRPCFQFFWAYTPKEIVGSYGNCLFFL